MSVRKKDAPVKQNNRKHFSLILVLFFLLLNYLVTLLPLGDVYENYVRDALFNIVKIFAYAYIGWLMIFHYEKSLFIAAISGAVVYFIDHVLLRLIYFSIIFWESESVTLLDFQKSFGGLLKVYFFSVPVVILISLIGGYAAKRKRKQS